MYRRFIAALPLVLPMLSACTGFASHKSVYTPPDRSQPTAQLITYPAQLSSVKESASLQRLEFQCLPGGRRQDEWTDLAKSSHRTDNTTSVRLTLPVGRNNFEYIHERLNAICRVRFAATFETGHVYALKMASDAKGPGCSVSMIDTTTGVPIHFDASNMGYVYDKGLCAASTPD